ncbi:MAG: hypothetical protein N2Z58_06665 [Fervidobacterium sp.]|nr:hypothetical protein [Fervidobacterium sp.]
MKFLDGVSVTYVLKSEKNSLSKLSKEIAKIGTKIEFQPINSRYYGHYRIEFYEPSDKLPTIKLTGFLTHENPIDWLMEQDNQSEIIFNETFHVVDTEIIEISKTDIIQSIVVEQYKIYSIINKDSSKDLTIEKLVKLTLKKLFEIYFGEEFKEDDYDIQIHPELTDYF